MKCTASYALPVFTLLLAFCHTVWSQDIVMAREGETVRLNCSYTLQDPPLPQNPTVIWKGPTGEVLSRSTRNFTLDLPDVKKNHSGKYECHIREVRYQKDIQLNVTDKAPKTEEGAGATGGARGSHPAVCAVTLLFLYLCLFH